MCTRIVLLAALAFIVGCIPVSVYGQISFSNATDSAGIETVGESWGAAWSDINGDNWPDVFMTNHWRVTVERSNYPEFYLNNQDGTFTKWSPTIFETDGHAAAFADPDNDGDQDLLIVTGRGGGNQLLVNQGSSSFFDFGPNLKLYDDKSRGRTPAWFDINSDGLLDAVITYAKPFAPYQMSNGFYARSRNNLFNVNAKLNYERTQSGSVATLCDVNGDQFPEMLMLYNKVNVVATEYKDVLASGISEDTIYSALNVVELACADFNNDLYTDVYCVRSTPLSSAVQVADNQVGAFLLPVGDEKGFSFAVTDSFHVEFTFNIFPHYPIYLGEDSIGSNFTDTVLSFDLPPVGLHGIRPHVAGVDTGIYLGFDSVSGFWEMYFSVPVTVKGMFSEITSLNPMGFVTLGEVYNFDADPDFIEDALMMNSAGLALQDRISVSGIDPATASYSAVAGDFDNDMDIDLYLVCASGYPNLPNRLYENDGSGFFTEVSLAGGAAGTSLGLGESATTVDYDRDGYLDLFVTNGNGDLFPGPCELWHNESSGRNFISLDLEGVFSNRDGIGTVVHLYAGGIAQLRENNNGGHRYSQNEPLLHFGLDTCSSIDSVVLFWPSGIVQTVYSPPVNSFTTIVEGTLGPVDIAYERVLPTPATATAATIAAIAKDELVVAPNPATDYLTFQVPGDTNLNGPIRIFSLDGQLVKYLEAASTVLDISELAPGTYFGSVAGYDFSFVKQ